ncbi:pheromone A receptor-domain-containing protein [Abortiporus biennis]|nr:pheromone A receptor-domain-containing protein [Abortiporus biennis]
MPHPEFPYIAFFAALLVLFPVPWHWRAGNVATLSMVFWLFVMNVIYGVDAIVWYQNVHVRIPVWCDITTKIQVAANIALPAACFCVCMHLERVASIRHVKTSVSDKRRRQLIEVMLCFVVPLLWMPIHYIVQGHRFDIIEDFGCRPNIYTSLPAVFLLWVPPLALAWGTSIFAVLALSHFMRRRISFSSHLSSRSGLTTSRYLRLMLLAVVEMLLSIATTSIALATAIPALRPWTNWSDVHFDFGRIGQTRAFEIPALYRRLYLVLWWSIPLSSFFFFVFFAFGQDAVQEYGSWFKWIGNHMFRLRVGESSTLRGFDTIPSFGFTRSKGATTTLSSLSTPTTASSKSFDTPLPLNYSKYFSKESKEHQLALPVHRLGSASTLDVPSYEQSVSPSSSTFSATHLSHYESHIQPHDAV